MTMADRIAVMDKGRIMQVATPVEVYEAPSSRFVADFIGNVNMFEGRVESLGEGRVSIATNDGIAINADCTGNPAKGSTVWFAIRPEKIHVGRQKPDAGLNAAEGVVWDVGYLGDMTIFNVKLKDGKVVKTAQLNATRTSDEPLSYDDPVWISFAPDTGMVLTS